MKKIILACTLAVIVVVGMATMLIPSAQAQSEPAVKTHLGGKASAIVHLVTRVQPVIVGETSTFIELDRYGNASPLTIPEHSVLVVTDIVATNCRGTSGEYIASLHAGEDSPNSMAKIYFNTNVEGEQKHIGFTSGVVFAEVPWVNVAEFSVSDLCVELYGYIVKD